QKVIIVTPLMQGFFIYAIEKSKLASSSPMPICHLTGNPSKRTSIAPFRHQGWKSSTNAPACIVDVDECQSPKPPCSVAPVVQCLNTPGSYMCGPCPQ
ncbi:hypothetical protein QYM36_019997, partial [Artemia franciscana]